jgi:hypothetical protein
MNPHILPKAFECTESMTEEHKQVIVAFLDQMERMPERSPADGFSNRDHDQIIYDLSK